MLYNMHYNKTITKYNHIHCYGLLTPSLGNTLIKAIKDKEKECMRYATKKTINNMPIILSIQSEYGEKDTVYNILDVMNDVKCPIYTVNHNHIGGYSSFIYLNGDKRFFRNNAKLYINNVNINNSSIVIPSLPDEMSFDFVEQYNKIPIDILYQLYKKYHYLDYDASRHYCYVDGIIL